MDKLANDNNGVKYLLASHDLLDRTVDANRMKREDSEEKVCSFLTMFTEKNRPSRIWVGKGTEVGEFKKTMQS